MYLSILIISAPILAANNRGENDGNIQPLQKVNTRTDSRSVLSGYSLKRAIRDAMQRDGASMWRQSLDNINTPDGTESVSGYIYTAEDGSFKATMNETVPPAPEAFDDTLCFGYMTAPKGSFKNRATKSRAQVTVSPALSTTPWDGDMAFVQGLKGDGDLAPFSQERHYTRYQFTLSANLSSFKSRPQAIKYLLNALKGLQVGGSHASNASELSPALIAWRFHSTPGGSGLYLAAGLNHEPNAPINLDVFHARMRDLNITDVNLAGVGQSMTISEGIEKIIDQALAQAV